MALSILFFFGNIHTHMYIFSTCAPKAAPQGVIGQFRVFVGFFSCYFLLEIYVYIYSMCALIAIVPRRESAWLFSCCSLLEIYVCDSVCTRLEPRHRMQSLHDGYL